MATKSALARAESVASLYGYVPHLVTPMHTFCPVGPFDIFGAMRLSMGVNFMALGAAKDRGLKRSSLLQECLGIAVLLYGGETFVCMMTGTTPSWLINPSLGLVFMAIHTLLTRTPLRAFIPQTPNLTFELLCTIPDALGRTLLLTRFTVIPLLGSRASTKPGTLIHALPATPTTLVLVPWLMCVPAAAVYISGLNGFASEFFVSTPNELKPWGWTAADAWLPLVVPALFLSLRGPMPELGWPYGLGLHLSEGASVMVCFVFVAAVFFARTMYNLGGWETRAKVPKRRGGKKIKRS